MSLESPNGYPVLKDMGNDLIIWKDGRLAHCQRVPLADLRAAEKDSEGLDGAGPLEGQQKRLEAARSRLKDMRRIFLA